MNFWHILPWALLIIVVVGEAALLFYCLYRSNHPKKEG